MRIGILGATGGTGLELVTQGVDRGHTISAMARRPDAIADVSAAVIKSKINAYDSATMVPVFRELDVAISAIGAGGLFQSRKAAGLLSGTAKHILEAAQIAGLKKLLIISSVGVLDDPHEEFVYRYGIKKVLKPYYDDMAIMEDMVRGSGVPYTLIRPPYLTSKPLTGEYRVEPEIVTRGYRLSRADLAHFLLDQAEEGTYLNKAVGVAY